MEVLTDHNDQRGFMKLKGLNGRQARWATELSMFNFGIEHRSGKTNSANMPSRRPDYVCEAQPDSRLLMKPQSQPSLDGEKAGASALVVRSTRAKALEKPYKGQPHRLLLSEIEDLQGHV